MKHLILVTSPPACGKTFISKQLARALTNCVYLDKDTLIVLSKQIFKVANEEYNRSSDFFEENIRDYEYMAVMKLAYEALEYNDTVLINAPFSREIRDEGYLLGLREELEIRGADLMIIWVHTDIEVCHQRMIQRASDRDTWKLENWEEYVASQNFDMPSHIEDLIVFENSSDAQFKKSLDRTVKIIRA